MFIFNNALVTKIGARDFLHVCIITHGGKVVSTGYNRPCGFNYKGKNYRRHAECDALLKMSNKYRNKKIRIYVIRKDYKMSKPCQHCLDFISSFRVKRIYYSDEGCLWYETEKNLTTNHVSFKYTSNNFSN